MKKRIERIGLSVILVLALVSVSNATLILSVSGNSMDISDPAIVVSVTSDASGGNTTWAVYLSPTSDYDNGYARLENPAVTAATGGNGGVTPLTPAAGHDYNAGGGGQGTGLWSTVDFVGLAVGSYTVELTSSAGSGSEIITVVPEPATIALLGLGGLFLTRRKRR